MKPSVLKTQIPDRNFDLGQALRWTAKARGIARWRLVAEIIRMGRRRQRLDWKGYFLFGAHQPGLSPEQRAEFLGDRVIRAINLALTPKPDGLTGLFTDKVLTDLVLTRCGLPVAPIRAVTGVAKTMAPYEVLRGVPELQRFLLTSPLPFFGKPAHGSRSVGAISITGREGSVVILGNGTRVEAGDLAAEILQSYPGGYIFQDLMQPHRDLAAISGPVIASVRVVTVRIGGEVEPLYAAMKMPGAGQMVDDIVSFVNTMCGIDDRTGVIVRGQDACKLGGTDMAANPVTGTVLAGAQVPLWPEVMQLAKAVHEVFPRQGLLCTDLAVTDTGPRVIEVNSTPLHSFYQKAFGRGFWNPDIVPKMTAALADCGHRKPTAEVPFP